MPVVRRCYHQHINIFILQCFSEIGCGGWLLLLNFFYSINAGICRPGIHITYMQHFAIFLGSKIFAYRKPSAVHAHTGYCYLFIGTGNVSVTAGGKARQNTVE